jgi:hypothetical protein
LASERIPRELLDASSDLRDVDAPVSAQGVDDAIELLLAYALLSVTADGTLGMRRLVQDQARTTAGREGCAVSAARAIALVDWVLPDRPWEHQQWPLCRRLLEHALTATGWAEQHEVARAQTARVGVLARVAQYQQISARGWRRDEPDPVPIEPPTIWPSTCAEPSWVLTFDQHPAKRETREDVHFAVALADLARRCRCGRGGRARSDDNCTIFSGDARARRENAG